MRRRNIVALTIFGVFYISFGILITLNQERIVYQPNDQEFTSCGRLKDAEQITYNGTRMYAHETVRPTAVLYHGNAGSACDRSLYTGLFTPAGYGYVIVEYAGYSNDARHPTHERVKQDVRNVVAYIEENDIGVAVVVGESIGTGAAAYHTTLRAPERLILISPFTDLVDIAKKRFWFYPSSLLVNNAFDNTGALREYAGDTLIIHGNRDSIIPISLGRQLFESLFSEKTFITISGAGHNDLFVYQETYEAITTFLRKE